MRKGIIIVLALAFLSVGGAALAFLTDCREVSKDTVCKPGEQRADFQAWDSKGRRMVYRCCHDSCKDGR